MSNKFFIKVIVSIICSIAFAFLALIVSQNYLIPMIKANSVANSAYAGEIIDKEIINASSGFLVSAPMDYRLVIEVPYEFEGEERVTEKSISVEKEIYLEADIGDWFDSHTLEVVKDKE